MYDDFPFDIDEITANVDRAEVMSIFFPTFRKALVIDTRSNETDGPMVRVMPMAASPQERMRTIRRLRSGFPRLTNLTLVPWPRYVDSLVSSGIWDRILDKLKDRGHEKAVSDFAEAFTELKKLEKAELAAVVMGRNYQTIWSASGR